MLSSAPLIDRKRTLQLISADLIRLIAQQLNTGSALQLSAAATRFRASLSETDQFWSDRLQRDYPWADKKNRTCRQAYRMARSTIRTVASDGTILYQNRDGLPHREDGPAAECANGTKVWYRDGRLHREGAPAVEYYDRGRAWYWHGNLHREDGPAIELSGGTREWYVHGMRADEKLGLNSTDGLILKPAAIGL